MLADGMEYKCCRNCGNLMEYPKNNRYGDISHLCLATGYFTSGVDKDIAKVKRYSPGGKELKCQWKQNRSRKGNGNNGENKEKSTKKLGAKEARK